MLVDKNLTKIRYGYFTIVPKTDLTVGTHTATVTVTGSSDIPPATFNVKFTVNAIIPIYKITLSESDTYTFPAALFGYTAQIPRIVLVTNTGNQFTGPLTVALSGTNSSAFSLSPTSIVGIASGFVQVNVVPNTGLEIGVYTATVTVSGGNGISEKFDVSFTVVDPAKSYTITGSGTAFTAARSGETIGTADQPIQTVIEAIRADASGQASIIQFGNGTDVLNIGTAYVMFNNTGGNWGPITLKGKINSAVAGSAGMGGGAGTIIIEVPVAIASTAEIKNTDTSATATNPSTSHAVVYSSTGTLTIQGGTIESASGVGVRLVYGNSTLTINGGTVSTSAGIAVRAESGGTTVNINGGTVSASANGTAVETVGTLNITDGTVSKTGTTGYTIINNGTGGNDLVNISGGTVSRDASGTGVTIENRNTGSITVSGGTVSATVGSAILNSSTGSVFISGGEIKAGYGTAVFNSGNGSVNIYGGTISTTMGVAIRNRNQGSIVVAGDALVTSANSNTSGTDAGTILFEASSSGMARLEVFDNAKIENTAGIAIYNNSSSTITIIDGTVTAATTGTAIFNNSSGALIIYGGTVTKTGTTGNTITNNSTGAVNIIGGTVTRSASSTGVTIENMSTGSITVSGGTVTGTSNTAVINVSTGSINISSGEISSYGNAIVNEGLGPVNISGGKVSSATSIAVRNQIQGIITVSGTATRITSANNDASGPNAGTIYLGSGATTGNVLDIKGGTIENTSASGIAVFNSSTSGILMTGGSVLTTGANATSVRLGSASSSTFRMIAGTVSATGGDNAYAISWASDSAIFMISRPPAVVNGNEGLVP